MYFLLGFQLIKLGFLSYVLRTQVKKTAFFYQWNSLFELPLLNYESYICDVILITNTWNLRFTLTKLILIRFIVIKATNQALWSLSHALILATTIA